MNLSSKALSLVCEARVAHLATADKNSRPHVVPICYAYRDGCFYFVVDAKPKRNAMRLKRLRNIEVNPSVALVIDRYDDDWSRLAFALFWGIAERVHGEDEWAQAVAALRDRYEGYRQMSLRFETNPVVRVAIARWHYWEATS